MKIIDFHTHIYPEKIAEKATAATSRFYEIGTDMIGTSEELLSRGKRAGISNYVLLPVATNPEQVRHVNEFVVSQTKEHSEFFGFGTLHPESENKLEELEFIIDSGLKGLKFHPDIQQFYADDKRLFEVFDCIRGKMPVIMHCGDKRYDFSDPARIRNIIDKFPGLQIIAAHLGGWSMFDKAFEYLYDTDCFLDISSCMMFLSADRIRKYISAYGADRILFGSDFPLWDPADELRSLRSLGLSTGDYEKISGGNAAKILSVE